jgi:hypothetical protein
VASAEAALPTLEEVDATLATAQGAVESMPAESRSAIQTAVSAAFPAIFEQADRILAESGLSSVLKPVIDGILEKLRAFAASDCRFGQTDPKSPRDLTAPFSWTGRWPVDPFGNCGGSIQARVGGAAQRKG